MIEEVNNGEYEPILRKFNPQFPVVMKKCPVCGKPLSSIFSTRCQTCKTKNEFKVNHTPTKEKLKKLIRNYSFSEVGEMYGISNTAIRKWCEKFGLPTQQKEIKLYSQEEWDAADFSEIPYVPYIRKQKIKKAIEEYSNGASLREIRKKYQIPTTTLYDVFKNLNMDTSKHYCPSLPIYKLNKDTLEILEEYPSINSTVGKNLGDVSACLHGRKKTSGGYKWIFKSEALDYKIGDIIPEELLPKYTRKVGK